MQTVPGYTVHIVNTVTGAVVFPELPYMGDVEFTRVLNDDGNITVKVAVGDPGVPNVERLRQLIAGWRFSLAVCVGNTVVACGPIMTHSFDHATQALQIGAGSFWALLHRRLLRHHSAVYTSPLSMDPSMDGDIINQSRPDIARGLVADGTTTRGGTFTLPIDFPDFMGGTSEYRYPIFDLASVGQRLKDLTQEEDGPDVDFDPYFSADNVIRYKMRIGNPELTQTGLDLLWDDGSGITKLDVDSDWSRMLNSSFVRGNATERNSQVYYARDGATVAAGWPELEVVDTTHQSASVPETLQAYANENVRFFRNPVETWKLTVATNETPVIGTYKPGDRLSVNVQSHPWIPPGLYQQRLLGWTNGGGQYRLNLHLEAGQGVI